MSLSDTIVFRQDSEDTEFLTTFGIRKVIVLITSLSSRNNNIH